MRGRAASVESRGSRLGQALPGDAQVGEVDQLAVPHDVVSAAQEDQVADLGRAAVCARPEVMDIAERWRLAAALGRAAAVAGSHRAALRRSDLVVGRRQADHLTTVVEDHALYPTVAEQSLDARAGGGAGPRGRAALRAR